MDGTTRVIWAVWDEDGFLWYEGRKPEKDLIKPGGENVYPAEVRRRSLDIPLSKG